MNVAIWQKSISNDYVLVYLQQKAPRLYQTFNNSFWKQSREPFKFSWNQVIRHLNWLSSAIPPSFPTFFWVQKPPRSTITQDTCYHTTITHKSMYFYCMSIWNFNYELKFFSWNQFHEIFFVKLSDIFGNISDTINESILALGHHLEREKGSSETKPSKGGFKSICHPFSPPP